MGYSKAIYVNCIKKWLCFLFFFSNRLLFPSPVSPACGMLSPELTCLDVQPNGDVVLTWNLPPSIDPSFDGYHIYKSSSLLGPYTVIDSIFSSAQTTYTHVGANANVAPVYYYLQSRCTGYVYTSPVDTLRTIHLTVSNPLNGTATLSWLAPTTPGLSSYSGNYNIYQEFPAGVWSLTGTKSNSNSSNYTFSDTIFVCNATINYRVELNDGSGCTSVSNSLGGVFQNTILPSIPTVDTLSVNDTNLAVLSWLQSTSPDVSAYVIYRFSGVSWVSIDTVVGLTNTSFTYSLSTATTGAEQYRIAALDSCGNISPLSPMFSTMKLSAAAEICNRSALLSWTAYNGNIGSGLSSYSIYQSTVDTSGPYTLVGSVSAATLNYAVSGLAPSSMYYFKVVATDASGLKTASSDRIGFYSATPLPPAYLYLRAASVNDPSSIELSCHVDVNASVSLYKVFRALDLDTLAPQFIQIGTIQPSAVTPITYSDTDVNIDKNRYYYKVMIVDSCGYDGIETNIAHTVLLNAKADSIPLQNKLTWPNYEGWPTGLESYNVYRGEDGVMNTSPIANVPVDSLGMNSYVDDVSSIITNKGVFNYYVEAVEASGNPLGYKDASKSNIVDVYLEPIIYIPNAFEPGGVKNTIFIPVMTYVDYEEYEFSVFNRLGRVVFSTNDLNQGWDGNANGKALEMGVYVYLIKIKTARGDYQILKGSVTLLR